MYNMGLPIEGQRVQFYCNNEAAVAVVNARYSHDPLIMFLRSLFFVKAYFYLDLRVVHIPGKDIVIADAISRDDLTTLHSQVLLILPSATPTPPRVMEILVEGQPNRTSIYWVRLFTS